jgi:molecular chaperone DnaK
MNSQQHAVGIDLGTTYSLVAFLDKTGRPACIPNEAGDSLTPSAIYADEDAVIVGKEAVKASVMKPEAYAECFKRDIGGTAFRRQVLGHHVPPEVLSAFVLESLRNDAERRLGDCRRVVITVPAFFDENRRRMTQNAGRLAGLEVLDIINEPTAAAIAYGREQGFLATSVHPEGGKPQRILVYDLGGGTFDVTVLEIDGSRFKTLATDGDVRLGGKDFDKRLVDHLARHFLDAHGVDPRSDPHDAAQLWLDAQEVKHALSERTKTTTVCFHAGIRMRIEVSRGEFEELTADLLARTETTTSLVVRQAGLDWSQIDRLLLVGGSSRMPMIRRMLRALSGKEPDCSQSPDEAVAHGAAFYAGELMAQEAGTEKSGCELINVNSHSLGVVGVEAKTRQKKNVILIPKNTSLPTRASRIFSTVKAGQLSVRVPVVEGESDRPEDCIALGECVVRGLPAGLPPRTKIEVEYHYAANGRISVVARIPSIRHSAHVEIERNQATNSDDLNTWRTRLLGMPAEGKNHFSPAVSLATVDLADRESIRKQLDLLLTKVGKAALRCNLPESLAASQSAALAAVKEAEEICSDLEKKQRRSSESTLHDPAAFRQGAEISQAQEAYQQASIRADFACLVLGRDCIENDFCPSGQKEAIAEIDRFQKHFDRLQDD